MKIANRLFVLMIVAVCVCSLLPVTLVGATSIRAATDDRCTTGHKFQHGYCAKCWMVDPDYVHPCADGHDINEVGACEDCAFYDPDFVPGATASPESDIGNEKGEDDNGFIVIGALAFLAVLLVVGSALIIFRLVKKK